MCNIMRKKEMKEGEREKGKQWKRSNKIPFTLENSHDSEYPFFIIMWKIFFLYMC